MPVSLAIFPCTGCFGDHGGFGRFLLRRGHSIVARVVGALWLGFFIWVATLSPPVEDTSNKIATNQREQSPAPEPLTEKQQNQSYISQLSEAEIASTCDLATKATMKSKGSFDTAWKWDYLQYPDAAQVVVIREFEAQNGFGATMSSAYRCVVDAKTKSLVQLAIKQGGGWDIIYRQ